MPIAPLSPATSNRVQRAFACRLAAAGRDAFAPVPEQMDNGDEAKYVDKSGTYSKGILQTGIGLVDLAAYQSFKKALTSGDPADFDKITIGPGGRPQNGPQGGLAFDLECLDSSQFFVPPAPTVESEEYAAELIEMYWASLLRDTNFSDYGTDPVAKKAAAELKEPAQQAVEAVKSTATDAVTTVKDEGTTSVQDVKNQTKDAKHTVQEAHS